MMSRFQLILSTVLCGCLSLWVSADEVAAQKANAKSQAKEANAVESTPAPKAKTVAQKLVGKIKFAKKELAFKEMTDDALVQKHARKVAKAGLNGRDPLFELPQNLAIASVKEDFENKWGDGIVAETSSSVVLKFHVTGTPVSDRSALQKLTSALETVYGGENAGGRVCFQGEGQTLGQASVYRSHLRGIKLALGLTEQDMKAYRVLKGFANDQPIELKEGRDLTAKQFDILAELVEKDRPIVVRIEGLDAASAEKKEEIKQTAETAVAELSQGPQDGVLTWKSDGQSWNFKHQPAQSPALKKFRALMKASKETYLEVTLTEGVLSTEYKTVEFRSGEAQAWDIAVIPSDTKKGLMVDLFTQAKLPYRFAVAQAVKGCDIQVNVSVEDTSISVGPARMQSFSELADMQLINFERDVLFTGYLSEPNCTASITPSKLPPVENQAFDQVIKFDSQCVQLCQIGVAAATAAEIELDSNQCRRDCVERAGYRECLEKVSSPLPLMSIEECQSGL